MKIRLDQVRFEPYSWQETCEVSAETLDRPEVASLGPVKWQGQVSYASPGFILQAHLSYRQTLTCNRCLKAIEDPVDSDAQWLVVVSTTQPRPGEHELHEKDLGVLYIPDEVLDTEPLLLEQLQLEIPMKPLCRPDCAGLCAECGADLNQGPCGCQGKAGDPRWSALAALRGHLQH